MPNNPIKTSTSILKIFISSKCDKEGEKYYTLRKNLKDTLSATGFFNVYTFETSGASSLSAQNHYKFKLEDADLCVVIIDNNDGIPNGVEDELRIIAKNNIKTLYYFCDQTNKTPTYLQKSLTAANKPKYQVVSTFDHLEDRIFNDIMNDLILVYTNSYSQTDASKNKLIPKSLLLESVTNTTNTILHFLNMDSSQVNTNTTNTLDSWSKEFIPILFGKETIKKFNCKLFLDDVQQYQSENYSKMINLRWASINDYYSDNLNKCEENLTAAYHLATDTNQPEWIIQDILIDLRNIQNLQNYKNNKSILYSTAQELLDATKSPVYYPIIDRLDSELNEIYIGRIALPHISEPGSINIISFNEINIIASILAIAMINGSLTHILRTFTRIRNYLFSYWNAIEDMQSALELLKLLIINRENKQSYNFYSNSNIEKIMDEHTAINLLDCSKVSPILHERKESWLIAFGLSGYYLNQSDYIANEKIFFDFVTQWSKDSNRIYYMGEYIISVFTNLYDRLDKDKLIDACCYMLSIKTRGIIFQLCNFFKNKLSLNDLGNNSKIQLLTSVCSIISDKNQNSAIKDNYGFTLKWSYQDPECKNMLSAALKKYLPTIYEDKFLIISENTDPNENFISMIKEYIKNVPSLDNSHRTIIHSNNRQNRISQILTYYSYDCPENLLSELVEACIINILSPHNILDTKIHTLELLVALNDKYTQTAKKELYKSLFDNLSTIETARDIGSLQSDDKHILISMISIFLYNIGYNTFPIFADSLNMISEENLQILVCNIADSQELSHSMNTNTSNVIFPFLLLWLCNKNEGVRLHAIRIVFNIYPNSNYQELLETKIIQLFTTDKINNKKMIILKDHDKNILTAQSKKTMHDYVLNHENYSLKKFYSDIQNK